ncbi:hypothetical protein VKA52_14650 [Halobacillus sp. HZG1]|uniref:hypothetical protein n=1 Tax=Halobacillus sp. HZG1 TaxID=3111769 RepID=UPI002DB5BA7A|nr:hypothetical protein [Halobacillus sp. HZG1]MEC3884973.1 hypothetical protein [Halobacillus sp. HZG1]
MWLIFGVIAIVVTFINLFLYAAGKDYKLAMALALSFTALTICADYSYLNRWIEAEDWAAIMDVVPGMSKVFWFLTIVSILLNISPIFLERIRKK